MPSSAIYYTPLLNNQRTSLNKKFSIHTKKLI